jgi:hypothetical protein
VVDVEGDGGLQNGGSRERDAKGKGIALFQDGNVSDDDGLY